MPPSLTSNARAIRLDRPETPAEFGPRITIDRFHRKRTRGHGPVKPDPGFANSGHSKTRLLQQVAEELGCGVIVTPRESWRRAILRRQARFPLPMASLRPESETCRKRTVPVHGQSIRAFSIVAGFMSAHKRSGKEHVPITSTRKIHPWQCHSLPTHGSLCHWLYSRLSSGVS